MDQVKKDCYNMSVLVSKLNTNFLEFEKFSYDVDESA